METLNLFYEEPDPDRWLPFDRFPRRWIRQKLRGVPRPGGQMRVFLNLCAGLDKIGVPYRINDYGHAARHPDEPVCIIGKSHLLDKVRWKNPILFGASVFSHPVDDPDLLKRLPVKQVLVPGEWYRKMFEPYYGDKVVAWPVGIDTDQWRPVSKEMSQKAEKTYDFLIYDKVRWEHDRYEKELIEPIRAELRRSGRTFSEIRYGQYEEDEFRKALSKCRGMIFLCEHESQGIAYQQALSCDVPVLAWDRGGYWQDPSYYPNKVKFSPVTSVPYWDDRCGLTFVNRNRFPSVCDQFLQMLKDKKISPRQYILEKLELGSKAREYVSIVEKAFYQK